MCKLRYCCKITEAVWDPNYGLAKVTNAVGKWSVFGHNIFGHNNVYVGGRCLFPGTNHACKKNQGWGSRNQFLITGPGVVNK